MRKIIGMASITVVLVLPISACQFDGGPMFDENTEHDVYFGKPTSSSEPLVMEVKKALRAYPTTSSLLVEVNLQSEGVVRVSGKVSTDTERQDVERIAEKVAGVKFVVNAVLVN